LLRRTIGRHGGADEARPDTPRRGGAQGRKVGGHNRWNGVVARNTDEKFYEMRRLRPRRDRPWRVFVNSLSDLFHEQAIERGWTAEVYYEMQVYRCHTFQVLTKRPEAAAAFYAAHRSARDLPNVWLGTSVENATVKHRIDTLKGIPAAKRFISFEPLIGPVGALDLRHIDWVIVGGESAREPRPMHADWVREIRDQCIEAKAAFFFKQWGGVPNHKRGGKEAVIDGCEWKQFP
jgi:protein gp37